MSKRGGGVGSDVGKVVLYLAFMSIPVGILGYLAFATYDLVKPSHS